MKTRALEHEIERAAERDALEHVEVAADEPVAAVEHKLDARLALVDGAELARCALALSVRVDLDVAKSGDGFVLVDEPHMRRRLAALLLLVVDGEDDRCRRRSGGARHFDGAARRRRRFVIRLVVVVELNEIGAMERLQSIGARS